MKTIVFIVLAAVLTAGIGAASPGKPTVEKGKALFNDPKLGTTGKTCNDCHADGKKLEKAAGEKDLESIVNTCITKALNGKALNPRSEEMQSLILYIKTLTPEKKR